ncbi:hypothetical protein ACFQU7_41215 [Pseudoroseomonas wenyumeiae]
MLLQGHAFAGVWLAQQDFGGSVVDDARACGTASRWTICGCSRRRS